MLTIRKTSKLNSKATEDISSQKKLYDTKKLKKVKSGALKSQSATDKEEIVYRKRNQDKDLKLVEVRKYYNQLIVKQKEKAISKQQKISLVAKILPIIMPNIKKICYKHDGSRMIEACLKYGSAEQRKEISESLKTQFYQLSCGKYSTHLAKRLVTSSEKDEKLEFGKIVQSKIKKFINDTNSCQVLDQIYDRSNCQTQKKLRHSFFGPQFELFSATTNDDDDGTQLKKFTQKHPEAIQNYENLLSKLVEKALVANVVVQDLMLEFIKLAPIEVNKAFFNESNLKVSFPSLLSSRNGVSVACYFYTIAEAKDRKHLVKLIKQKLKDYIINKIDCIFILKLILTTDDTVLVKRSIIQKILQISDSSITHPEYQKIIGVLFNQSQEQSQKKNNKAILSKEQIFSLNFGNQFSTSKKQMNQRMSQILDQNTYMVLSKVISSHLVELIQNQNYIFIGSYLRYSLRHQQIDYCKKASIECFDGLLKYFTDYFEATGKKNIAILSDPAGHRFLKYLINLQASKQGQQKFTKFIWSKMKGQFIEHIKTKAVFVLISLIESKSQVCEEGKKNKEKIKKELKSLKQKGVKNSGVSVLYNLLK